MGKASGSPTPPQSAWSQPGSTPGPESYPYSAGMSPARSPSTGGYPRGPAAPPASSMWGAQWQNNNGNTELAAPPATSESVDMLSMLGHHGAASSYESLGSMFTGRQYQSISRSNINSLF